MDLHVLMRCLNENGLCFFYILFVSFRFVSCVRMRVLFCFVLFLFPLFASQRNLLFRITLNGHTWLCKMNEKYAMLFWAIFKWDRDVRLCNQSICCPLTIIQLFIESHNGMIIIIYYCLFLSLAICFAYCNEFIFLSWKQLNDESHQVIKHETLIMKRKIT